MDNEPRSESLDELHWRLRRKTTPFLLDLLMICWSCWLLFAGAERAARGLVHSIVLRDIITLVLVIPCGIWFLEHHSRSTDSN